MGNGISFNPTKAQQLENVFKGNQGPSIGKQLGKIVDKVIDFGGTVLDTAYESAKNAWNG